MSIKLKHKDFIIFPTNLLSIEIINDLKDQYLKQSGYKNLHSVRINLADLYNVTNIDDAEFLLFNISSILKHKYLIYCKPGTIRPLMLCANSKKSAKSLIDKLGKMD